MGIALRIGWFEIDELGWDEFMEMYKQLGEWRDELANKINKASN
ncbi:MAG: hypothetical protein V3T43_02885 [Nitrosomonadaceae bacterium]